MMIYVLVSRRGTAFGETRVSNKYSEIYRFMKEEYGDTLQELKGQRNVQFASCSNFEASIVTEDEEMEWFIISKSIADNYMGIRLNNDQLISKEDFLKRIESEGANYDALATIREEYSLKLGKDIIWNYTLSDDLHTGFMLIPVKEEFMSLPYDVVLEDTFEQFILDEARLMDKESLNNALDDWCSYSNELVQALQEAKEVIWGER